MFAKEGFDFRITTTAKNLVYSLKKNKNWICVHHAVTKSNNTRLKSINNSIRKVMVTSFKYKENKIKLGGVSQ